MAHTDQGSPGVDADIFLTRCRIENSDKGGATPFFSSHLTSLYEMKKKPADAVGHVACEECKPFLCKLIDEQPEEVELLIVVESLEDVPVKISSGVAFALQRAKVKELPVVGDVSVNLLSHPQEGRSAMVSGTLPIQQYEQPVVGCYPVHYYH